MINPRPAGEITPRERVLEEAKRVVMERDKTYGHPTPFFRAVAKRWSLTLGIEISARQVVLCLIDMKQQRACAGGSDDTPVDIAGYGAILAELGDGVLELTEVAA